MGGAAGALRLSLSLSGNMPSTEDRRKAPAAHPPCPLSLRSTQRVLTLVLWFAAPHGQKVADGVEIVGEHVHEGLIVQAIVLIFGHDMQLYDGGPGCQERH